MSEAEDDQGAIFHELKLGSSSGFSDPYVKQNLTKWDLWRNMRCHQFRYTKAYHKMAADEFLIDFFNDKNVQASFQVLEGRDSWISASGKVKSVSHKAVKAVVTRTDMFDRFTDSDPPIVRGNSAIVKCMEEVIDGFTVSDNLREMLVKGDESENHGLFPEEEKEEFLFRVFEHLALGGSMNQFEDDIDAYIGVTKKVYKELLSVQKNPSTGKVEVTSPVFAVTAIDTDGGWSLFPYESRNNFLYVTM
eukprot:CAMPEP_0117680924 /NCGR_PEP_ID=MMETSP0804-20121206/18651_1 /TAXON_ID=1074897 /ORGANISM="Tetraselmis astigmatica, Strain CCMP880" /LENGTH=247 /DNA_ID=CAMNT_0005490533 /DNA_START=203 /DNA_END=943 /DNA_ORIENTATION=+